MYNSVFYVKQNPMPHAFDIVYAVNMFIIINNGLYLNGIFTVARPSTVKHPRNCSPHRVGKLSSIATYNCTLSIRSNLLHQNKSDDWS